MRLPTVIQELFAALTSSPPKAKPNLCVLPQPVARVEKGKPKKPEPTIYEIDKTRKAYGFHQHGTEADRVGAEQWITGHDRVVLQARSLDGGKKVEAQNDKAKAHWWAGDDAAKTAKAMRLSDSWVEKRFAAFSTALSQELENSTSTLQIVAEKNLQTEIQ